MARSGSRSPQSRERAAKANTNTGIENTNKQMFQSLDRSVGFDGSVIFFSESIMKPGRLIVWVMTAALAISSAASDSLSPPQSAEKEKRSKPEVEALIEKEGSTQPGWWDAVA